MSLSNVKNYSNVSLENFTWSGTLPTNTVKFEKIYYRNWN